MRLIEHGLRPIVIERGKDVHERKKTLLPFHELIRLIMKVIIVLVKVVPVLILMENYIQEVRRGVI